MGIRFRLSHCAVTIAASAFVSWVAASDAEACRREFSNQAFEPIMADFVRSADSIYLARAIDVERIPDSEDEHSTYYRQLNHRYTFDVVSVIDGEARGRFEMLAGKPFDADEFTRCATARPQGEVRNCEYFETNESTRLGAHVEAERGHLGWSQFYQISSGTSFDAPSVYFGESALQNYCGLSGPSFELGETYLIFTDDTMPLPRTEWGGLNFALITREDDLWLSAVRYFVRHQEATTLPPVSLDTWVDHIIAPGADIEIVTPDACEVIAHNQIDFTVTWGSGEVFDDTVRMRYPDNAAEAIATHCEQGGQFAHIPRVIDEDQYYRAFMMEWAGLPPMPIRDGMVDLSVFPGVLRFEEGDQIALDRLRDMVDAPGDVSRTDTTWR